MAYKSLSTKAKGYLLSLLIVLSVIGIWHAATLPKQITAPTDPLRLEYRILMGDIPEFTKPGAIVAIQKKRISKPNRICQDCMGAYL